MASPIYRAPDQQGLPAHTTEVPEPQPFDFSQFLRNKGEPRFVWSEYSDGRLDLAETYPGYDDYDEAHLSKREALKAKQIELRRARLRIDAQLLDIEEALLD